MKNPNGYGSVVKLSGNRRRPFAVRITAGYDSSGRQLYEYLGYYETRKDANIALAMYNSNPYDANLRNITFEGLYRKFYDMKKNQGASEKRLKAYGSLFKKVAPLHRLKMVDIRTIQLQTLFDTFTDEAPLYVREIKSFVGLVFKYAMKTDIVDKNYTQFIELRKFRKIRKNSIFTPAEQERLWENVGKIEGADIILILIYTGFRINELLSVTKDRVDLENWTVRSGSKTDAGKDRIVPIHHRIQHLIVGHMKNKTSYLLPSPKIDKHMGYTHFRKIFKKCMEELGMAHNIHDTRYTFITSLREVSENNAVITGIVGHTNISMTDRYTITNIQKMRQVIDKLN